MLSGGTDEDPLDRKPGRALVVAKMFAPMTLVPDLRAWLDGHTADSASLSLRRPEIKALFDELQRLRQSNDMLRKQNRKVRGKVAKLRDDGEPEIDDTGSGSP